MDTLTPRDFTISSRQFDEDQEWFGLHANPSGAINVPTTDPYRPAEPQNLTSSLRKVMNMSGETTITVIGNLTSDPELRFTPVSREFGKTEGTPVANFTIASTPRAFDAQSREWKDGETLFLRSTVWREAAEHVAASLTKGSRVVASGRLKPRTYETKTGEKRTVIEFEIDEIGLSLRYTAAEAKASQTNRTRQDEAPVQVDTPRVGWGDRGKALNEAAAAEAGHGGYADDDPWFGKNAAGVEGAQPPRTAEPTF